MQLIAPDYYLRFQCIADKCRHSCCIGWEIDVDPETRDLYRRIGGPFGERLNAAIQDGDPAVFRLGPDERCPMLNQNGLCDLITELGEGVLCQICADHPRFRNDFTTRTEIGLGLCCEAAAMLVLSQEGPMELVTLEDDDEIFPLPEKREEALWKLRHRLITRMQDRTHSVAARLDALLTLTGTRIPDLDWQDFYYDLERLDPAWDDVLTTLDLSLPVAEGSLSIAFEQFAVYLLYRHLPGALEDNDLSGRVVFCVLSTKILMALCAARPGCTLADCADLARMYSAEIEYSDLNLSALLDAIFEGE